MTSHKCNKEREIDLIYKKLDKIETKIDDLNSWKLKIIGGSLVIMFVVSIIFKTKLF